MQQTDVTGMRCSPLLMTRGKSHDNAEEMQPQHFSVGR